MKKLVSVKVDCPPEMWPNKFTGTCCIGILKTPGKGPLSLWLLFTVADGVAKAAEAVTETGDKVPDIIAATKPDLVAYAPYEIWELIPKDLKAFSAATKGGKLAIHGNFRTFGRFSVSLLRGAGKTDLWDNIEKIVSFVEASSSGKA
jgi:hypothetical protein